MTKTLFNLSQQLLRATTSIAVLNKDTSIRQVLIILPPPLRVKRSSQAVYLRLDTRCLVCSCVEHITMGHDVDGTTVSSRGFLSVAARALCAVCSRAVQPGTISVLVSDYSHSPQSCATCGVNMTPSNVSVRNKRIKVGVRLRPFTRTEKLKAGGKAAWTWYSRYV